MILHQGDPSKEPGRWKYVTRDGKMTARISCPDCTLVATLEPDPKEGHVIDAQGTVTPSVDCPTPDCRFHDHVTLRGWAGG